MFGYQLVKRFPSPGYEIWEDWREHYLSTGMKLGWTAEEMMKWLPTKLCGWALNAVSDLPRGYWRSSPGKQAWTLTETLYQFDIRLSDNPNFYERSYNLFVRGKAGSSVEFSETSGTVDQRTQQQYAQRQVIDTSSVGISLIDQFRQPGRSFEGFGIGSRCGVSRKEAFSEDLFGEVEDTRVAESGSEIRIPDCGDEVQNRTEVEITEEICGQVNQDINRAAVRENENSGFREIPTEEKVIERRVESCGPVEHHAMENSYVLSPEYEEISDEQLDDDYLFEDASDTDFSDVEEFDDNDERSERSFAASLNSVICDNVTAIVSSFGGCVKASRSDLLGAWALMKLKTGGLDQKFCNATNVADETQMCTTEGTVDTLENWTSSGGTDGQLVCETQKGQNNKAAGDRSNVAQLGKELEEWVQSQLNESQLNGSDSVEPKDEHQVDSAGVDRIGKYYQKSMAKVLHSRVHDDQQPRREDSRRFSMEVEQKVERRIASRFPEIARLLLENRALSRKERWSRLEASGQQSWLDYRRNGSYSGRRGGHPFKRQRKKVFMYRCTSV